MIVIPNFEIISTLLIFRDGDKMYGRGSTDDKGPVLGWLHVIQAFQACKMDLPVNMKFCFEGNLQI